MSTFEKWAQQLVEELQEEWASFNLPMNWGELLQLVEDIIEADDFGFTVVWQALDELENDQMRLYAAMNRPELFAEACGEVQFRRSSRDGASVRTESMLLDFLHAANDWWRANEKRLV